MSAPMRWASSPRACSRRAFPGLGLAGLGLAALHVAGCGEAQRPRLDGALPYDTLSEYGFFVGDPKEQRPAKGVFEIEPNAVLWSDNADKRRFVVMPDDTTRVRLPDAVEPGSDPFGEADWEWPVGSVLIKSFAFRDDFRDPESPSKLIETRLLVRGEADWDNHVYRWNDEQTEATRTVAGDSVELTYIDALGQTVSETYLVPNTNQCKTCHEQKDDRSRPLGARVAQLHREVTRDGVAQNQLSWLEAMGVVELGASELAAWSQPYGDDALEQRARAYLGANCSHCHNPNGKGGSTGLDLRPSQTDPGQYGVCKYPVAAGGGAGGLEFDIVPGKPEESILVFRMSSVDPAIKMPELPNRVVDPQGLGLVTEWIAAMEPVGCPE